MRINARRATEADQAVRGCVVCERFPDIEEHLTAYGDRYFTVQCSDHWNGNPDVSYGLGTTEADAVIDYNWTARNHISIAVRA